MLLPMLPVLFRLLLLFMFMNFQLSPNTLPLSICYASGHAWVSINFSTGIIEHTNPYMSAY